jgi:hypothetical protein
MKIPYADCAKEVSLKKNYGALRGQSDQMAISGKIRIFM